MNLRENERLHRSDRAANPMRKMSRAEVLFQLTRPGAPVCHSSFTSNSDVTSVAAYNRLTVDSTRVETLHSFFAKRTSRGGAPFES